MVQQQRAVIYTRVSTEDQDSARQLADLRAFAARAGYLIVGEYDETASGANNDRKIRKQILEMARRREMDVILVTEMTRWGRSTEDLLSTLQDLAEKKVSLIALSGQMTFDMSSAMGRMMVTVLAAVSEFERNLLRERTISGIEQARRAGKHLGRPKMDPDLVSCIEGHLRAGKSVRETAKLLNCSPTSVQKVSSGMAK